MESVSLQINPFDPSHESYIKVDKNIGKVVGHLALRTFKNEGDYFIYVPELNLSAYGNSPKEAEQMFSVVFSEFSSGLLELSTKQMNAELAKYGFRPKILARKKFNYSGSYIDSEGILKDFELPADTVIEEKALAIS